MIKPVNRQIMVQSSLKMTKEAVLLATKKISKPGADEQARRVRAYIDWNVGEEDVAEDLEDLAEGLDAQDKDYMLIAAQNAADGEGLPQFQTEVAQYLDSREDYSGSSTDQSSTDIDE